MLFVPQAPMCGGAWFGVPEEEMHKDWKSSGKLAASKLAASKKGGSQAGGSKALAIRNPKTGEVIGSPALPPTTAAANALPAMSPLPTPRSSATTTITEEGEKEKSEAPAKSDKLSQGKVDSLRKALLKKTDLSKVLQSAKCKGAVAEVMARRFGNVPYAPDHSTFTALNIDCSVKEASKRNIGLRLSHGLSLGGAGSAEGRVRKDTSSTVRDDVEREEVSTTASTTGVSEESLTRSVSCCDEETLQGADVMSRSHLLGFRRVIDRAAPPQELQGLAAHETPCLFQQLRREPAARSSPKESPKVAPPQSPTQQLPLTPVCSTADTPQSPRGSQRNDRRALKGLSSESLSTPTGRGSRFSLGTPKGPLDELRRTVMSLLNKVCPENVAIICEQVAEIKPQNAAELELIISQVFSKAIAEPHYCESYADLVFGLKGAFPEFPPAKEGGRPVTFKSALLDICQKEFEAIPTMFAAKNDDETMDAEEIEFRRKKAKDRVLANMKLIGHLFLRQLLSAKVIGSVIQELTLCDRADEVPQDNIIECACELLTSIGYTLESMPVGAKALVQVCGRLQDLKQRKGQDGKNIYSKRIQFAIQDLLDTRKAGWTKRTFKSSAKTKDEIRDEQRRALNAQARGQEVEAAECVVAGQRPAYLANAAGKKQN